MYTNTHTYIDTCLDIHIYIYIYIHHDDVSELYATYNEIVKITNKQNTSTRAEVNKSNVNPEGEGGGEAAAPYLFVYIPLVDFCKFRCLGVLLDFDNICCI